MEKKLKDEIAELQEEIKKQKEEAEINHTKYQNEVASLKYVKEQKTQDINALENKVSMLDKENSQLKLNLEALNVQVFEERKTH